MRQKIKRGCWLGALGAVVGLFVFGLSPVEVYRVFENMTTEFIIFVLIPGLLAGAFLTVRASNYFEWLGGFMGMVAGTYYHFNLGSRVESIRAVSSNSFDVVMRTLADDAAVLKAPLVNFFDGLIILLLPLLGGSVVMAVILLVERAIEELGKLRGIPKEPSLDLGVMARVQRRQCFGKMLWPVGCACCGRDQTGSLTEGVHSTSGSALPPDEIIYCETCRRHFPPDLVPVRMIGVLFVVLALCVFGLGRVLLITVGGMIGIELVGYWIAVARGASMVGSCVNRDRPVRRHGFQAGRRILPDGSEDELELVFDLTSYGRRFTYLNHVTPHTHLRNADGSYANRDFRRAK